MQLFTPKICPFMCNIEIVFIWIKLLELQHSGVHEKYSFHDFMPSIFRNYWKNEARECQNSSISVKNSNSGFTTIVTTLLMFFLFYIYYHLYHRFIIIYFHFYFNFFLIFTLFNFFHHDSTQIAMKKIDALSSDILNLKMPNNTDVIEQVITDTSF